MSKKRTVSWWVILPALNLSFLSSCNAGQLPPGAVGPPDQESVTAPTPAPAGELGASLGQFRNTYYYIAVEELESAEAESEELRTSSGELLARVTPSFKKKLDLEGSGRLVDGRVVNVSHSVDGVSRYRISPYPYGLGVGNCPLEPFLSIAVDPERIPLGSVVRIEETIGMPLPDGTFHDGFWRAEDTGGAIQGDRIDLFLGESENARWLARAKIGHLQALSVRLVTKGKLSDCLSRTKR